MQAPNDAAVSKPVVRSVGPAAPAPPAGATAGPGAGRLTLSAVRTAVADMPASGQRPRHRVLRLSFLVCVALPVLLWSAYLFGVAEDQYHSELAFSIRSEEIASAAAGILGAITQVSGGVANDAEIVNEYISSRAIVEEVDAEVDLAGIYRKPAFDPVFSLGGDSRIEDLTDFWNRVVHVSYENRSGIINIRTVAFTPEDARRINEAILSSSNALVNRLSEQARQDAIRYAAIDLDEAEANLRQQRQQLADFRAQYHIVDPEADVAGQLGVLTALQSELAQALVERDMLLTYVSEDDQRVVQATRRIDAITARIAEERTNLGIGGEGVNIADVVGEYEGLRTDLEFAAAAYTQALTNLALARAEGRRQARYLAVHIPPTLAQESLYPQRWLLIGLAGAFLAMAWGIAMIVYYNIRDSR
jgi:capsular polysaccharide transport system permease protein